MALNIIPTDTNDVTLEKAAKKLLEKARIAASATDNQLTELVRYDSNIIQGITNVVKEQKISDIILGLHKKQGISDSFLGNLTEGILSRINVTTLIYRFTQPLNTINRYFIIAPVDAEMEIGFPFWLLRVWNIGRNTGAKLVFYGTNSLIKYVQEVQRNHAVQIEFREFSEWEDFLIISRDMKENDALFIVMSRKNEISYDPIMKSIPKYLNRYFQSYNYILAYPMQHGLSDFKAGNIFSPFVNNFDRLDDIGQIITALFKRK